MEINIQNTRNPIYIVMEKLQERAAQMRFGRITCVLKIAEGKMVFASIIEQDENIKLI